MYSVNLPSSAIHKCGTVKLPFDHEDNDKLWWYLADHFVLRTLVNVLQHHFAQQCWHGQ